VLFRSGAIIVHKDDIISSGWSHVSVVCFGRIFSIHAEQHAISRCISNYGRNLVDCRIFIATINRCGNLAMSSAPCEECQKRIDKVGISAEAVYFTTGQRQDLVAA